MKNIGIIIGREYKERVFKKSFIITTIIVPVLMLALCAAPTLLMAFGGSEKRTVTVIDQSGIIADRLQSDEETEFIVSTASLQEELVASLEKEQFGVLWIGEDIIKDPKHVNLYTNRTSSMMFEENLASQIGDIIEEERLKEYNLGNVKEILEKVKADVTLSTFRNDKGEDKEASSSSASSVVGMVLGFILYFFLAIYGSIVMQSIIEEKNSRILDVMVSTVRPFDLMMGKILGIASVAATQIVIWGAIIVLCTSVIVPMVMPSDVISQVQAVQGGADMQALAAQAGGNFDPEMISAMASIMDTGYITMIISTLFVFLIGGFLLFASMYAAVGASVDEVQDAQQLTTIVTIPIIAAFLVIMLIMKDPNSPIVWWCSMIPFTSPIVMMARIPAGIPTWEIITSATILYITFIGMVWAAGKVYRVGIFTHGAKPKLKDLWRWMKY